MRKASRSRPDGGDPGTNNEQEETRRRAWRGARLVRDLRRPDGADDELLCDARRVLQSGPAKIEDRRGVDAGSIWRADRGALFRDHRIRWRADPAETEKHRACST